MTFERYISQRGRSKGHPDKVTVSMSRITFPTELLRKHGPGKERVALYYSADHRAIGFRFTDELRDTYKMSGKDSKTIEPFPFWRKLDPKNTHDAWQGNHPTKIVKDSDYGDLLVITLEGSAKTE